MLIRNKLQILNYLVKSNTQFSAEENYNIGILYYNLGFFEESITHFEQVIVADYKITQSLQYKDACSKFLDHISEATQSYLACTFFNCKPKCADTYVRWGNMSLVLEHGNLFNARLALYYYNQSIKLDSDNIEAYNMRGDAKIIIGLYLDALDDYEQALKLNQKNNHALMCKEILLSIEGEITKVKISEKAYKIMSEKDYLPEFMDNMGFKYLKQEELNQMSETVENSLEKAKLYIEEYEWDLALSEIDTVLKLKPRNKQAKELKVLAQELFEEVGY